MDKLFKLLAGTPALKPLRDLFKTILSRAGFELRLQKILAGEFRGIPDEPYYVYQENNQTPLFSPWAKGGLGDFRTYYEAAFPYTIISADRLHVLYSLALQALNVEGLFFECGVYKGGTAILLSKLLAGKASGKDKRLHLFDNFEGLPEADPSRDRLKKGDFSDTSLEAVRSRMPEPRLVEFHKGFIPDTFSGLEDVKIAFAHIDVDLYRSVADCCAFIYPRLRPGGFMVFDDYGYPCCPGARKAVDEYFSGRKDVPLVLPTGQAVVFKGPE